MKISSRQQQQYISQESKMCDRIILESDGTESPECFKGPFEDEDRSQTLQFCEQIEEVSEESLQNSIHDSKVGAHSFEPISMIGQGSFGEVYLVRKKDTKPERYYAMKVLQKERILG
jgi:serine/threonine protein kinase SCH9